MKVKNQTYDLAKKRMSSYVKLTNSKIFMYSTAFLFLFLALTGFFFGEENWFILAFFTFWLIMMSFLIWSFWVTRDVIWLVNDGVLQIPRLILGPKRSNDPFQIIAHKLPEYLRCAKCSDPAISQKRVAWTFHDICRECGNDNRVS